MKNWILRASAMAFAAGLMGTLACGGSSCGGTNVNSNSSSTTSGTIVCGTGTYLFNNDVCLPIATTNSSTSGGSKVISN